jgi:hypothetical protein
MQITSNAMRYIVHKKGISVFRKKRAHSSQLCYQTVPTSPSASSLSYEHKIIHVITLQETGYEQSSAEISPHLCFQTSYYQQKKHTRWTMRGKDQILK